MRIPGYVRAVLDTLYAAGFEAYVVGGCVRDALMGREPDDYDVTTSASPTEMLAVFRSFRVIETGLQHGTVTVLSDGRGVEVTTYRVDGAYTDNRRPDTVTFTRSLAEDVARRDFTVNAMAYSPVSGLMDFYDGQGDLARGCIRCVGDPATRFREDGLRLLRAMRFAAVLDFTTDSATAGAMHALYPLLANISRERVHTELTKLLCGTAAPRILTEFAEIAAFTLPGLSETHLHTAARRLARLRQPQYACPPAGTNGCASDKADGNEDACLPHAAALSSTTETAEERALARIAAYRCDAALAYALLLAPGGNAPAPDVKAAVRSLKMARQEENAIFALTEQPLPCRQTDSAARFGDSHDPSAPWSRYTLRSLAGRYGFDYLPRRVAFAWAMGCLPDAAAAVAAFRACDALTAEKPCVSLATLCLHGGDLLQRGVTGAAVGEHLRAALEEVLHDRLPNDADALGAFLNARLSPDAGEQACRDKQLLAAREALRRDKASRRPGPPLCESCLYWDIPPEDDLVNTGDGAPSCTLRMDEDEKPFSRPGEGCPYYRYYDEYTSVRRQN